MRRMFPTPQLGGRRDLTTLPTSKLLHHHLEIDRVYSNGFSTNFFHSAASMVKVRSKAGCVDGLHLELSGEEDGKVLSTSRSSIC